MNWHHYSSKVNSSSQRGSKLKRRNKLMKFHYKNNKKPDKGVGNETFRGRRTIWSRDATSQQIDGNQELNGKDANVAPTSQNVGGRKD